MMQLLKLISVLKDAKFYPQKSAIDSNMEYTCVSIDSRKVEANQLFVAIRGEKFDGHDFIHEAEKKGAVAVISEKYIDNLKIPQIIVEDSIEALTTIAKIHRLDMSCKTIALTGSNGKTTVKEMIASILPKPSFATIGNLNNHIGVPLCVLKLEKKYRYAVFELGANHIGEIIHTVSMVKPDIALINNIAPAHIEGFGSIDGVANAKGEIYQGLSETGIAIINNDDVYANYWNNILKTKKAIRFSVKTISDVYASEIEFNKEGSARFRLNTPSGFEYVQLLVPGQHNVSNALAAAACSFAADISLLDIKHGLENFKGVSGRITFKEGKKKTIIIDDTYNANLKSVLTALDVLAARDGYRVLVLGDMGELGVHTTEHHSEIGRFAKALKIDKVFTCGNYSKATSDAFGDNGYHYKDQSTLLTDLIKYLDDKTTILVKGSRMSAMENIVKELIV
jgi:UDP-N-acetylmuramoyl-tripeptide--D-alanyl-D-alanine ligase